MEQPTNMPSAKVTTATAAGALSILIVYLLGEIGHGISPEAAAAITTLLAFAGGYFKRETGPVTGGGQRGATDPLTLLVYLLVVLILVAVLFAVLDRI